jgi:N-acetyl-gamma-glutamyl-phosphate reductase
MIKAGIVGATGYAGAELVRLLIGHPQAELAAVSSVSFEGKAISEVYPAYYHLCDMVCGTQEEVVEASDVIFAALPHGLSQDLAQVCYDSGKVFIDLGADFRLEEESDYQEWYGGTFKNKELHEQSVYALPELFREQIKNKKVIANPGCYTTAVPLALAPAVKNGLVKTEGIIADCKSGVTGAGRKPTQNTHYPDLNEGFSA